MSQGLLRSDRDHLLPRQSAERSARCRQNNPLQALPGFPVETLPYGAGFAVDGEDLSSVSPRRIENDPPCHDQRFLVGHGDLLACTDGVESRQQTHRTHQSVNDDADLVDGSNLPEA